MSALRSFAMAALGGAVVLAFGYMATSWSVNRKLDSAARMVSNKAAKQDRLDPAHAVLPPVEPTLRREIEVLPSGAARVTLVDPAGRVVYRGDPATGETIVARDAALPSGIHPTAPEMRPGGTEHAAAPTGSITARDDLQAAPASARGGRTEGPLTIR